MLEANKIFQFGEDPIISINSGAGRAIIEGANIHIFMITDCKNNRFQKKLIKQNAHI